MDELKDFFYLLLLIKNPYDIIPKELIKGRLEGNKMLENFLFILVAFSLFIVIFSKIIKKDDTTYLVLLLFQFVGIAIDFSELNLGRRYSATVVIIRYLFAIIMPIAVIVLEIKDFDFAEILRVLMAKIYLLFGNNKKAKDCLGKLVTINPNSYYGHKMLAEIYEQEGGMRKAIDEYVTVIDIKGNSYQSYFKISKLLNELGKKDEAIQMLTKLIKNKPEMIEATYLLGDLLTESERFKEAANVYESALRYYPGDFDLYYNLGIVYTRLNNFQVAKEMYEKAAKINSRNFALKYSLGQIALIEQEIDLAEAYFNEVTEDEELSPEAYYQLARIAAIKGENNKAIQLLNRAINLDGRLLKRASKEKVFKDIRQSISVSVNMGEEKPKHEKKQNPNSHILTEQEDLARKYLDATNSLIEDMSENSTRQETAERVTTLINTQSNKKSLEEFENKNQDLGFVEKPNLNKDKMQVQYDQLIQEEERKKQEEKRNEYREQMKKAEMLKIQNEKLKKDNENFENVQKRYEQTIKKIQNVYLKKSNKNYKLERAEDTERTDNNGITEINNSDQNKRIKGE